MQPKLSKHPSIDKQNERIGDMLATGDHGLYQGAEGAVRVNEHQPQLQGYIDRLEAQVQKATHANAAVGGCLDRAIGPTPTGVDATDRGAPQGMLSRLDQLLDQLDVQTEIALGNARRLSEIL